MASEPNLRVRPPDERRSERVRLLCKVGVAVSLAGALVLWIYVIFGSHAPTQ